MEHVDVAVIGAGQSGPATAQALLRDGLRPVVLEAWERAAGSWPRYYDSLTLFSPARYSALPGLPFPGADPHRYPHRDEVVAYLTAYAAHLDADIRTGRRVAAVRRGDGGFEVELEGGDRLTERPVTAEEAETAARMFKALGDPIRLRLFSAVASHAGGRRACATSPTSASPSRRSPTT